MKIKTQSAASMLTYDLSFPNHSEDECISRYYKAFERAIVARSWRHPADFVISQLILQSASKEKFNDETPVMLKLERKLQ